jgi:hypothetical protein
MNPPAVGVLAAVLLGIESEDLHVAQNKVSSPGLGQLSEISAGETRRTALTVGGRRFERIAIGTHWVATGEDIGEVAERYIAAERRPGDCLLVSEKVVSVSLGKTIPAAGLRPGPLARRLSRSVTPGPVPGLLDVPEKMQYVINTAGRPRVIVGAAAHAIARRFGIEGTFYRVVGEWCRAIDGMTPPYEDLVIPPLGAHVAQQVASELRARLEMPVGILDLHDRGGTIPAVAGDIDPELLLRALADNPLGQRTQATPIGLLRRLPDPA